MVENAPRTESEEFESIDVTENGVAVKPDRARRLIPESRPLLASLLCRVFGHSWEGHPFEADETYPAATCGVCNELRVARVPLSEIET